MGYAKRKVGMLNSFDVFRTLSQFGLSNIHTMHLLKKRVSDVSSFLAHVAS